MSREGVPYKQRFKGIENFLRRVAFNLGNTPSQTEVKIISCIPIDVTDLQQKINSLERELREVRTNTTSANNNAKSNRTAAVVQTAIGKPNLMGCKSRDKKCEYSTQAKVPVSHHGCNTTLNKRGFKRKISKLFVVSSFSTGGNTELCRFAYSDSNIPEMEPPVIPERVSKISSKIFPKRLKKVLKKKPRKKTHLVYFAQALNSPFNSYDKPSNFSSVNKNLLSRAYINKMIRKQYEPELMADRLTDISQFSSPVCRDNNNRDSYPSDISCSYEKYENLDKCYPKTNHINIDVNNNFPIDPGPLMIHSEDDRNNYSRYYNSDDYDIYPVKEKPVKQKKEDVLPKQMKKWNAEWGHEHFNTKVNLTPVMCSNDETNRVYDARTMYKTRNKNGHEFTIKNIRRKNNRTHVRQGANSSEPKVCSIDYGDIYVKRNLAEKTQRVNAVVKPTFKNAECETENTNNIECQTVESKGVQLNIPDENKAELALNQIKNILQSVLAEVKSNIKHHNVVSRPKKDVVVQKDVSHNNMTYGSALLNSFNYNPSYNINPCLATYPRQTPNFYYANIQSPTVKCLQNFPLIFPNLKHNEFECHRKDHVNTETEPMPSKPATTTATNTEAETYTSPPKSETMNLINEIYKSIALNVNYSSKNTSHMSIGYPKNMRSDLNSVATKEMTILEQESREEKETQFETPALVMSCDIDNALGTHTTSSIQTDASSESERFVIEEFPQTIIEEEDKVYNTSEALENEASRRSESKNENETRSSSSISEHVPEADMEVEKKAKLGLLQKMFDTVKMLKKKNVSNRMQRARTVDERKSSDSETDMQTIYSYKTHRDKKPSRQTIEKPGQANRREFLKDIVETDRESGVKIQESSRKQSPYMEQEYRRYWDEKLMFNENKSPMHFSEKSYSGRAPDNTMFWRGYEARSAILKKRLSKTLREQCRPPRLDTLPKERSGLKLEWLKKQKFKTPALENS